MKIGETKCWYYQSTNSRCTNCPLYLLNCDVCGYWDRNWPLYEILNEACSCAGIGVDNPIYKAFKAELDKEVE